MKKAMKVPNQWTAVQFSTENNYQTSAWHVFAPNNSQSLCGKANTHGTAKSQGESEVSRIITAGSAEKLAEKLGRKLGASCQACEGKL
jgi:hypothetical protein